MTRSSIIRLLLVPFVLLIPLMACNLSASAGSVTEKLQVIVTATTSETDPEDNDNVTSSSQSIESATTSTASIEASDTSLNQVSSNSQSQTSVNDDLYYVRGNRPQNQCAIRATVTTNIRTSASISASIVGQLVGGEWVPISRLVNGWYQIDLSATPVHRMWISSEPTELDSICRCEANGCARSQITPTPDVNNDRFYAGNPMPAPASGCYVYTAGDFNVNIRAAQSETSTILGQLLANHWISVRHFTNGWFGVDLPNTPVDGAYISSGPAQLSPTCTCTDLSCTIRTGPIVCDLSTHPNTVTQVYTEPSNWSKVVGQLTTGETYTAIARSSSGWYQLEIGGWVPSNYLKLSADGSCHNLPVISYDAPIFDCELVNTTDDIVTIVNAPDGDYFGRFWPNNQLGVISRQGKWVQVYVAAFENAGWVDATGMAFAGDCDNFQ